MSGAILVTGGEGRCLTSMLHASLKELVKLGIYMPWSCRARILIHVISPSSGLHSGGRSEIFNE
jgi:hypothetical protein